MPTTQKKDIAWVNTLKGGCILLVVLYHVVLPGYANMVPHLTAGELPARLWLIINNTLSPLRMPAFSLSPGCWQPMPSSTGRGNRCSPAASPICSISIFSGA